MDTRTVTGKGFPFKVYLNCPDTGSIMNYLNCYIEENIDSFFDKIYEFEKEKYMEKNNKIQINEIDNIEIYKTISFKLDTVHDFTESRKDESVLTTQEIFTYLDWKDIYPNKKNNFESDFFFWLLRRKEFLNETNKTIETHYKDFDLYVTSTIENYCNLSINSTKELNIVIDASDTKVNNFKNLILFQNFYDQAIKKYNNENEIKKIQCVNRKINPSNTLELRELSTDKLVDTIIENNRLNCKIIYPQLFDANATTGKTIKWRNYNIGKMDTEDTKDETDEINFKILENNCRIVFVKKTKTVYFQIKNGDFYFDTIKIIQRETSNLKSDTILKDNISQNIVIKNLEEQLNKNEIELNSKNFKIKEKIKIKGKNYTKTKNMSLLFYNTGPGISELLKYYETYKKVLLIEKNELLVILRNIHNEIVKKDTSEYIILFQIFVDDFIKNNKNNKHIDGLKYIIEKLKIDIYSKVSRVSRITIEKLSKFANEYYETKYKKLAENIFIIKRAGDYSQIFYCKTRESNDKSYIFSSIDRMSASFCLLEKVNFIGTIKEYGIFLKFTKNIIMENLKEPRSMKCNKFHHYKTYLDSPNISKYIKFLNINFNLNYMKCYDVLFYYEFVKLISEKQSGNNSTYTIDDKDVKNLYRNMAFKIDTVHDFKKDRTNGLFTKEDEDDIYSILWKKINIGNKSFGYEPGSLLDKNFLKNIINRLNDKVDYDENMEYSEENSNIHDNDEDEEDENAEETDEENLLNLQNYDIEEEVVDAQSKINQIALSSSLTDKTDKKLGIIKNNVFDSGFNNVLVNRKRKYTDDKQDIKKKPRIESIKDIEKIKQDKDINQKNIKTKEELIDKKSYEELDVGTALTFILENLEENFFYWLINRQYNPIQPNGKIYTLKNSLNIVFSSSIENFSECISKDTNTLCIDASSKIISNFKNMLIVNNILNKYPSEIEIENKINDIKDIINNDIYFITKKQGENVFGYLKKNLSDIISEIVNINTSKEKFSSGELTLDYNTIVNIYYNLSLFFRMCIINEISTEYVNIIFYILNGPNGVLKYKPLEKLIDGIENKEKFFAKLKNLNYKFQLNINDEYLYYLLLDDNVIYENSESIDITLKKKMIMKFIVIFSNMSEMIDVSENISKFDKILTSFKKKKRLSKKINKDESISSVENNYIIDHINYIYEQLENEYKFEYEDIYKDEILSRIHYETISNETGAKFKIIPPQIFDANTSTGKHITIKKKNLEEAMDGTEKFCIIDKYKKNIDFYNKNKIDIIKLIKDFDKKFDELSLLLEKIKNYNSLNKFHRNLDCIYDLILNINLRTERTNNGTELMNSYIKFLEDLYLYIKSYTYKQTFLSDDRISGFIKIIVENVEKIKIYIYSINKLLEKEKDINIIDVFKINSELLGYGKPNKVLKFSEIVKTELKLYKESHSNDTFNECDINIVSSNIKSKFTESKTLYTYKVEEENTIEEIHVESNIYEITIDTHLNYPLVKVKVLNINKDNIKDNIFKKNKDTIISNEMANIILRDLDTHYEDNIFYKFLKTNMKKNIFTKYIETDENGKKIKKNIKDNYFIFDNFINKIHTYYCGKNKTLYCYDTGPGVADLAEFYKNYLKYQVHQNVDKKDILQNIFDIKRYGDYSQIAYCKKNKYIYVSNDRMSASFSFIEDSEFIGPFKSFGLFLKKEENRCAGKNREENDNYEDVICQS